MTDFPVHPLTWFAAVVVVAVGAVVLAVCAWVQHRRAGRIASYAMSYAAVPALVVGQIVFVMTSHVMLGIVTFLLAWALTDRNTRLSPSVSSTSPH